MLMNELQFSFIKSRFDHFHAFPDKMWFFKHLACIRLREENIQFFLEFKIAIAWCPKGKKKIKYENVRTPHLLGTDGTFYFFKYMNIYCLKKSEGLFHMLCQLLRRFSSKLTKKVSVLLMASEGGRPECIASASKSFISDLYLS